MRQGDTWSILPAYTVSGYLPCTGIKKGFYNTEDCLEWLIHDLLPLCNPYPEPRSIVCLDNLSLHTNNRISQTIEARGCLVWFLPPYLPDYSPIELTFSVLKAWMKQHFRRLRGSFHDFGGFLAHAVEESQCDKHAVAHFKHSASGYTFNGDYETYQRELNGWTNSNSEELGL